jgi:hypothetical protein
MADAHFAQFHRLEPMVRPAGPGGFLDDALEARVADPLFLLGRQWQLAEFQGEDGGSPVSSRLEISSAAVNRFRPGDDGTPLPLPPGMPVEYLVEGGGSQRLSLRAAARAGLRFLSQLDALPETAMDAVTRAVLTECPLQPPASPVGVRDCDPAGRALHRALASRAPDGPALDARLAAGWRPAGLSAAQAQVFDEAGRRWRAWFAAEYRPPAPSSWVRERLEHRFSVGASLAGRQIALTAPEHTGGPIEAYHLDIDTRAGQSLGAPPAASPTVVRTTLPTRATYPGMPSARWWEFEDSTVNLPAIDAGPADLARLLVVEFANVYGTDHWVIPVDLGIGEIHLITRLTVTDTFGDTLDIGPVDDEGWSMFRLSDAATGRPGLPLLPLLTSASGQVAGEPVEEVLFVRDEMANLGWAIERVVPGATGRPRRRGDEIPDDDPPPASPDPGALGYRLLTPVPAHWIPLVPVPLVPGSTAIRFRRGQIPRTFPDGTRGPQVRAAGQILEPEVRPVYFREEEIPRSGLTVTRVPVAARDENGALLCWVGRQVHAGRGEASSALAFDDALPPRAGPA